MNTTDQDIKCLEVFVSNNRYILKSSPNSDKAQEVRAASNILSDFRDMRQMVEAADAYDIAFDGIGEIRKTRMFSTILARRFGNPDIKTEHDSALDAWRDGVKGEK